MLRESHTFCVLKTGIKRGSAALVGLGVHLPGQHIGTVGGPGVSTVEEVEVGGGEAFSLVENIARSFLDGLTAVQSVLSLLYLSNPRAVGVLGASLESPIVGLVVGLGKPPVRVAGEGLVVLAPVPSCLASLGPGFPFFERFTLGSGSQCVAPTFVADCLAVAVASTSCQEVTFIGMKLVLLMHSLLNVPQL